LKHPVRLNASIAAAVKLLYEISDGVVVLDDLFKSEDSSINRWQRNTLLEITRIIADGIEPARMRGFKIAMAAPRCGALFTGEFYIGDGSNAARLFPAKMTIPIDNDKFTECQNEPLVLSTFYSYLLEWYINDFDGIVSVLKQWRAKYRSMKSNVHDRLAETHFCLESAFKLFLTYREEKGFITNETAWDEHNSFDQQLRAIVSEQNNRVNQGGTGESTQVDYLTLIRTLFNQDRFRVVYIVKEFRKSEHDGVVHGDCLYLRKDRLMAKILSLDSGATFDDVLKCLTSQGALKPDPKGNSRKIGGISLRFYAIKLAKLRKEI
jgi:hypothetical protein